MKIKKLLKLHGISIEEGSWDEEIYWKSTGQKSVECTFLDDGYITPQGSLHFKTPQPLCSGDVVDNVETITFPIEVNAIIVSQTPTLTNTISELQTSDVIPEIPQISDIVVTIKLSKIKIKEKLLKLHGISIEEGSWDEEIYWKSTGQKSVECTFLDDGYITPQGSLHFKTPQPLCSGDVVDNVGTITFPIEVNAIIVSQTPTLTNTISELQISDVIPEIPQISDIVVTTKHNKIRQLKRRVRCLISGVHPRKSKSAKVTPATVSVEEEQEAPVCGALRRLRQRCAMFYV